MGLCVGLSMWVTEAFREEKSVRSVRAENTTKKHPGV